jgi:hypothetical protein
MVAHAPETGLTSCLVEINVAILPRHFQTRHLAARQIWLVLVRILEFGLGGFSPLMAGGWPA